MFASLGQLGERSWIKIKDPAYAQARDRTEIFERYPAKSLCRGENRCP